MARRGGVVLRVAPFAALLLLLLLYVDGLDAKKAAKKGKGKPLSMDELAQQQNEVLLAAADLGNAGRFMEAAAKIKELTDRVTNINKSGGLGANLFNTIGEYYRVARELDASEEAFEAAIGCITGFRAMADTSGDDEQMHKARMYVDTNEMHRARSNIAKLRELDGDPEGVVEQYKILMREAELPEYKARAAKELGVYHLRHDDLELAKAFLSFAVEIHPTVSKGYSNLALVLHKLDELDEAEEAFLEAIKLDPDNPNAYANLATLYAQSGEVHDAEKYFKLTLEKDPNHADAKEKLQALEEMKDEERDSASPKFRSPMKKVGGERKARQKVEL
eukprot:jgi/Tetstr1/429166/TSEL_019119.t1